MISDDRALVTADLQRLPGLRDKGWGAHGAALGVAVTGGVGATLGALVGAHDGVLLGAFASMAVTGPAALIGAWLGGRWRRGLLRDGGRVTVARWLRRYALDGAVVGAGSGLSTALVMAAVAPGAGSLGRLAEVATLFGLVGGMAGAVLLTGLGLPFALRLGQGKKPWGALVAGALAGPPVLVGAFAVLHGLARWLF